MNANIKTSPSELGLYWARISSSIEYNYIVKIEGKYPFLTFIAWHLSYPLNKSEEKLHLAGSNPIKFVFNYKIEDFNYKNKIDVPEKSGLYWAIENIGDIDSKIVLAYIHGEVPYMSCYIWDYKNDFKNRIFDVSSLTFIEYISKPTKEEIL